MIFNKLSDAVAPGNAFDRFTRSTLVLILLTGAFLIPNNLLAPNNVWAQALVNFESFEVKKASI